MDRTGAGPTPSGDGPVKGRPGLAAVPVAAALTVLLLAGCAGGSRWTRKPDFGEWNAAAAELESRFPGYGAVILEDRARVDVYPRGEHSFSEYTRRTVVKILDGRGGRYANVIIPYGSGADVTSVRARTLCPDGRVIPLDPADVFDTTYNPETVFFSDGRARRFTVPGVEPGCIVEIEWSLAVGHFSFWNRWNFQADVPVGSSSFTVRCPSDWPLRWKAYGIDARPDVETAARGMQADRVWSASGLPPFRPEPGMPAGDGAMRLLVSPAGMKTWDDAAAWLESEFLDRTAPDPGIRDRVRTLAPDASAGTAPLRTLFEFVRDRIRYVAIEIGEGGYRPHPAGSVLRNRYGDCKDMAVLLAAAGKAAGRTVHPALLATRNAGELDTSLVSPAQFNHAIAAAEAPDGSLVWMDATEKECPFGDLPWTDAGVLALVLKGDGKAHFVRTPGGSKRDNRLVRVWGLEAGGSERGGGSVTMTFDGAAAEDMRRLLGRMEGDGIRKWMGGQILGRFPGAVCDSASAEALESPDRPLRIRARFSSAGLIPDDGSFQPGLVAMYDWNAPFSDTSRTADVTFPYPLAVTDTVRLVTPVSPGASGPADFAAADSCAGATAEWSWTGRSPGQWIYRRCVRLAGNRVEPPGYAAFRDFLNRVALTDRRTFRIGRTDASSDGSGPSRNSTASR
jgi:hypothetical protein